jgi:hypothetical protein
MPAPRVGRQGSNRLHVRIDKASFPVTVRVGHCGHGTFWEGLLGVRVRLSDPELANNLRDFLERREVWSSRSMRRHLRSSSHTNFIRSKPVWN